MIGSHSVLDEGGLIMGDFDRVFETGMVKTEHPQQFQQGAVRLLLL